MKKFVCFIFVILLITTCFFKPQYKMDVFADNVDYDCKSYVLLDYNSGKVLLEKNKDEKLQVASMVKLMTALLTIEKIEKNEWDLNTKLVTSEYAASMEGSQAFLDAGCEYSIDDLLKSIIVASANDSCVVVAENYAGSEQNFVKIMNERARQLGMNNTYYENSTGLPSPNEYSCASDIGKILKEITKHEIYHKYATIWMDKLIHKSGRETELVNTNRLIKYYDGCDCGKTGFTDEAGYCLSASAKRNDLRLISVVTGCKSSKDRFEISSKILNYGFANFVSKKVVDSTQTLDFAGKIKGVKDKVEVNAIEDCFVTCGRNQENNVEIKYKWKDLKSPIKKGDNVGTILIVEDGVVIQEVALVSVKDYKKQSYFNYVEEIADNWSIC